MRVLWFSARNTWDSAALFMQNRLNVLLYLLKILFCWADIFHVRASLHSHSSTFWIPVTCLFCPLCCQLVVPLFSADALIIKWKNNTNPQVCLSLPGPSQSSHSKHGHSSFSTQSETHTHTAVRAYSSLFDLSVFVDLSKAYRKHLAASPNSPCSTCLLV